MKIKFMTKLISAVCVAAMATSCVAMPVGAVPFGAAVPVKALDGDRDDLRSGENDLSTIEEESDEEDSSVIYNDDSYTDLDELATKLQSAFRGHSFRVRFLEAAYLG